MPKTAQQARQNTFKLSEEGRHLWTREKAREIRSKIEQLLEQSAEEGLVVIDASGVEVFDYSFAAELFGKLALQLNSEFPRRHLAVTGLTAYTRENLDAALERIGAMLLDIRQGKWNLLGKTSPSDARTLTALQEAGRPVGAPELAKTLGINVTACNERLSKLMQFGLVRRNETAAGRLQYLYSFIMD